MAKVLIFKDVISDVEKRMKEFEKMRSKLKADIKKEEAKSPEGGKENKGLLKSISGFFSDSSKTPVNMPTKK